MGKINKRKLKEKANSAIAGTLASSILVSSCTYYDSDGVIYDEYKPNIDLGQAALPISITLNANDASYVNAIQHICLDVLQDQTIAKQVANDPKGMFAKYGYNGPIDTGSNVFKLIEALGDDEINQALEEKNIGKFISLCESRGLLSGATKDSILQKYNDQIKDLLANGQTRVVIPPEQMQINADTVVNLVPFAGATAIFAVLAGIVAGVAIAINYYVAAHSKTAFVSKNKIMMTPSIGDGGDDGWIRDSITILNLPSIKNNDSYQMFEEYYGEVADELIKSIEANRPEVFNNITKEELRQLIITSTIRNILYANQNRI